MQRSALCRSRRELSNAYFVAKFGLDTAENEPCQVRAGAAPRRRREVQADGRLRRAVELRAEQLRWRCPSQARLLWIGNSFFAGKIIIEIAFFEINQILLSFGGLVLGCIQSDF